MDQVSQIIEEHVKRRENEIANEFRNIRKSAIWSIHQDADLMIDDLDTEIERLSSALGQQTPVPSMVESYALKIIRFAQNELAEFRKDVMVAQIKRCSYFKSVRDAVEAIDGCTFIGLDVMDGKVSVRAEKGEYPNKQTLRAVFIEEQMDDFLKDPLPMLRAGIAGLSMLLQ